MFLVTIFFLVLFATTYCNQVTISDDGTILFIKDLHEFSSFQVHASRINLAKITEVKLFNSTPGIFFCAGPFSDLLIPELESWTRSSSLEKVSFINPPCQYSPNSNYFGFMTAINFTNLQLIIFNESSYDPDVFFRSGINGRRRFKNLANIKEIQLDFITQPAVTWKLRRSIENTLEDLHLLAPTLETLEVVDVPFCIDKRKARELLKRLAPMNLSSLMMDINFFSKFNAETDWAVFNSFLTLKNFYLQFDHTLFLQHVTNAEFQKYCLTPFEIGQYVEIRNLDLSQGYIGVFNGEVDFTIPLQAFRRYIKTHNPNFKYTLLNNTVELDLDKILPPEVPHTSDLAFDGFPIYLSE